MLNINRTGGAAAPGQALSSGWSRTNPPVSLGMLPDGPLARVAVPREIAARLGPGSTLAVSEEPPGGSPTPTKVVAAGADQRAVTALGSAEAAGEAVGEAAEQRRVEVGAGGERGAERVEDAGADLGALDDGGEEPGLELRLGEGADDAFVADPVADRRHPGGAGRHRVVQRDAAGGGDARSGARNTGRRRGRR